MTSTVVATVCNVQRHQYTEGQRLEAVRLLQEVGPSEAARQTGIARGTISSWASRAGVESGLATVATAAATEARTATIAERKTKLADELAAAAERMLADLFAATTERKAFGATRWNDSEVVTIHNPTTTATERKVTIEAIAKAVETVNLLTGEATQRIEQLTGDGTPAPERAKAEETVLQLVQGTAA